MTDFKALLRNPPEAARGMTRWWWYGCAVEEKEIDRELNLMKEAANSVPASPGRQGEGRTKRPLFLAAFF